MKYSEVGAGSQGHASPAFDELKRLAASGVMVRTHSAQVRPGDIFVAQLGASTDGASFIPDAVARGASWVLGLEGTLGEVPRGFTFVPHPDPRAALGELAAAHFKTERLPFKLIGVTGTNGKTTITYLIEHLFLHAGKRVGALGTVSYRWPGQVIDAPLTTPGCWQLHEFMARMAESGVEVAVMEASSHALDQNRTAGLEFDCAVLTNVTQDHLDYHGDMESYFQAKARLFTQIPRRDKRAVLNWDDPYGRKLLAVVPNAVGFGLTAPHREWRGEALQGAVLSSSVSGLEMEMRWHGETWLLFSPLVGRHNASNLLGAQAVGLAMGLRPEHMQGFKDFMGVPGRLERIPNNRGLNIFVDYAHTPDALENVLAAVKELNFKRLFTVFGCGGNRDKTKRPLMGKAVCKYSDVAVLTSDNPRHENPLDIMNDVRPGLRDCPMVLETPDRRMAITVAIEEMRTTDVLVVAGKGHEAYQQIGDEKRPFSDQAVIREILS